MFKYIIFWIFVIASSYSFNISNLNDYTRLQIAKNSKMLYISKSLLNLKYDYGKNNIQDDDENVNKMKSDIRYSHLDNTIYFYSPLTEESALDLEKKLLALNTINIKQEKSTPIHLHIQSFGGSLFHTLYLVDLIQKLETPVYTYVDGFSASAGTLLSVVCKKRFISKHSIMLIHQLSGGVQGKYFEMKDENDNIELLMNMILDIYINTTKLDKNKLMELLHHDLWLNAETCLKYGLVDEII